MDIAQDIIINEHDCGTHDGVWIRKRDDVAGQSLSSRLYSRLLAENVIDPKTGEVIGEYNDIINQELARKIAASGVAEVKVRSALTDLYGRSGLTSRSSIPRQIRQYHSAELPKCACS